MEIQQTLGESLKRVDKYGRTGKQWQKLTKAVTYAIAKDMMPLCSVERPGFKRMLSTCDNRYELPSRK